MAETPHNPAEIQHLDIPVSYNMHTLAREIMLQSGVSRGEDLSPREYQRYARWSDETGLLDYVLWADSSDDKQPHALTVYDHSVSEETLDCSFYFDKSNISTIHFRSSQGKFASLEGYSSKHDVIMGILLSAPNVDFLPETDTSEEETSEFWELATQYAAQSALDDKKLARTARMLIETTNPLHDALLADRIVQHFSSLGLQQATPAMAKELIQAEAQRRKDWLTSLDINLTE